MLRKCLSLLLALVMAVPLSMMAAAAEADHNSAQEMTNHLGILIPAASGALQCVLRLLDWLRCGNEFEVVDFPGELFHSVCRVHALQE